MNNLKTVNILSWSEYLKDWGKLNLYQWVQCLIDSGNISKQDGELAIGVYDANEGQIDIEFS